MSWNPECGHKIPMPCHDCCRQQRDNLVKENNDLKDFIIAFANHSQYAGIDSYYDPDDADGTWGTNSYIKFVDELKKNHPTCKNRHPQYGDFLK